MLKSSRFILLLSAALLFTPWLATYAYGAVSGAVTDEAVQIESAKPPASPRATFYGMAAGSVSPGDLFYIDATGHGRDINATLYLTNTGDLTRYLKHLTLKIGIYAEDCNGQWQPALLSDSAAVPDAFLSLHSRPMSFSLAGDTRYKVTIDSGSFYCFTTNISGEKPSPQFYLTVEPAQGSSAPGGGDGAGY